ncbi:cysteine proteinase inhibitor 1-like [Rutidosis leptorrhynchoides]|uniref:cysteine proteinase inhibitor 1-like n=1 Tax=Rutidosis leptorrhynchoides TaxID=125765 RepID=UPI003A9A32DD
MANVSIKFFMLLVAFMLSNSCVISGEGILTLGDNWQPIVDLNVPWLIDLAKFAVDVHNQKNHVSLIWIGVVEGWTRNAFGIDYKMIIRATDGSIQNNYEAIVHRVPLRSLVLKSFTGPFVIQILVQNLYDKIIDLTKVTSAI